MMMIHLSQTPPNMSSIGAVCDSLGKTFLTLLIANLWATGELREGPHATVHVLLYLT